MRLSLIVPCCNEQENVEPMFARIKEVFENDIPEIIFVDDGSSDGTLSCLKSLYTENQTVRLISFTRNFGKEAAILAGLRAARGDLICIIDGDLQQDPAVALEMSTMLEKDDSLDVVAAYQKSRREGLIHRFCKTCFYKMGKHLCDLDLEPHASDFRVFRRHVAQAILSDPECERFSKGIFAWAGFKTAYIPYDVKERNAGKSKWKTSSLTRYALDGIFSFSEKPLRFPLTLSIICFLASVITLILTIAWDAGAVLEILLPLSLVMFSLIFFTLWVLGRYAALALREAKRRPVYVIREFLDR